MADPLTTMGIMAGGNILGGVAGNLFGSGDRKKQERLMRQALAQFDGLDIPDVEKMRLYLEELESVGELDPILQATPEELDSRLADIQTDPRLENAQLDALEALQERGSTGFSAQEMAERRMMDRELDRQAQAEQMAMLQNAAQRGVGGSGLEFAARLAGIQNADQRRAEAYDRLVAQGQQRALEAIAQGGQLGGQIRSQDFGEQTTIAQAIDRMNMQNMANRMNVEEANVNRQNQAQAANLANRQRIADANVGTRNMQQQYNKQLAQQNFDNEMALRQARANAMTGQAGYYGNRAANTAQNWANIGAGAGQAAGMLYAGGAFNSKPTKDNPFQNVKTQNEYEQAMNKGLGVVGTQVMPQNSALNKYDPSRS